MRTTNPILNVFSPLLLALATAAVAGLAAFTPLQQTAPVVASAPTATASLTA